MIITCYQSSECTGPVTNDRFPEDEEFQIDPDPAGRHHFPVRQASARSSFGVRMNATAAAHISGIAASATRVPP